MLAKRVDGDVGGDVADGLGGGPPLGINTDILVEATVVGWRTRDVGNDVSLPTRDGRGSRSLRSRISSNVGMPQHTPRRALEKFRKSGADPDFAERRRLDALANEALMDKRRFDDSD